MPLGAANVIWHSSPGDCLFSFEDFYAGPDPGVYTFSLPVPVLAGASPSNALFVLISATDPFGVYNFWYEDAAAVVHGATAWFTGNHSFVLAAFANVGTAGGSIKLQVGNYKLLFISGTVVRSSTGVAVACAVDLGLPATLANGIAGSDGTPSTAVGGLVSGTSSAPAVTVADPGGRGVVIAGSLAITSSVYGGSGAAGWIDIVADVQPVGRGTGSEPGNPSTFEPPSAVVLSVNDNSQPFNPAQVWALSGPTGWDASAGILWVPPGADPGGAAQIVG